MNNEVSLKVAITVVLECSQRLRSIPLMSLDHVVMRLFASDEWPVDAQKDMDGIIWKVWASS